MNNFISHACAVSGNNGVHYVVQIISKLLDPKTSEHTATFVGRLVSILITKMASQLGENLDLMLRAVLSKMQQAEALSVIQVKACLRQASSSTQSHCYDDTNSDYPYWSH